MKAWLPVLLTLALTTALHAQGALATCTYPKAPDAPPDGNTATRDEMITAKHDFDRYNSEMNAYLDCIKLEIDAATPKDPSKMTSDEKKKAEQTSQMLSQKHNAAVDELQANVGRFNEQLKAFKAKNKPT